MLDAVRTDQDKLLSVAAGLYPLILLMYYGIANEKKKWIRYVIKK